MDNVQSRLIYQFIRVQAESTLDADAVLHKDRLVNYVELRSWVDAVATQLIHQGLEAVERVVVYLLEIPETVFSLFGAAKAGGVFVPVNPLLKPNQVVYTLRDCNVSILDASPERLSLLAGALEEPHDLRIVNVN